MTPRKVRYSKTFVDRLLDYTDLGEIKYGERLAQEKKRLVFALLDDTIALTPAIKRRHSKLGLVVYSISGTPFIVIYDYDDEEIRVMSCFLRGAGDRIEDFDPADVEW